MICMMILSLIQDFLIFLAQTDALPVQPPTDGGVSRTSRLVLGDYLFVVGVGLLLGLFFIFLIWVFQAGQSRGRYQGRKVIGGGQGEVEEGHSGRRKRRRKKSRRPRNPTLAEKKRDLEKDESGLAE